jgi:choline dehydrogenase-like flavoprotein
MAADFDAIVVGSGITGGWAAKELTERGLRVLMLERGRPIEHGQDYVTEWKAPWEMPFRGIGDAAQHARDFPIWRRKFFLDEWTEGHFAKDAEHAYQTDPAAPFLWYRAYQLGGRSLVWGRQAQRMSDLDFSANARDGHGTDWPLRYADLAPWYDHVERFIGVSGNADGIAQLPDGCFQPPMGLNAVEKHTRDVIARDWPDRRLVIGRTANLTAPLEGQVRAPCQYRNVCPRGCSFGAYFSTQSSTLPAARATGLLTVMTHALVESVEWDDLTKRASGVRVHHTREGRSATYAAPLIFLCASTLNSVGILLRSRSTRWPTGLANSSGTLGRFLMDHATTLSASATFSNFQSRYYFGNRPNSVIIPRFRNVDAPHEGFLRGYQFQGLAVRRGYRRGGNEAGIGAAFKARLREPGKWSMALVTFAECLPSADNRVTLHPTALDGDGLPQLDIRFRYGDNERRMLVDAAREARAMLERAGGTIAVSLEQPDPPGSAIHEMGGARMGRDPRTSVLNGRSQAHDVPNLYVTDGAAMASSGSQNPSLTYMALTARACDHAVAQLSAARAGVTASISSAGRMPLSQPKP